MTTQLAQTPLTPARSTSRRTTTAFLLPGILALTIAIYMVGWNPEFTSYENLKDRLTDGLFVAYLAATVVGGVAAARAGLAPRAVAGLIGVGYGLIMSAVVAMNVMSDEPSWFMFVAGPGQLLSMAGFVGWAVWGKRHGLFSLSLALLCAVGSVTAIIGSRAGLSVLIAGFWFALAGRRPRP